MPKLSRRNFFRNSTLAAGGLIIGTQQAAKTATPATRPDPALRHDPDGSGASLQTPDNFGASGHNPDLPPESRPDPDLPLEARRIAEAAAGNDHPRQLDLSPAKWIWFPGQRTLANSLFFFRKGIQLRDKPVRAEGWILGDSRYKLYANGQRIQFGPAPYDPRWAEADPVDLSGIMSSGLNMIGAEVLFYGTGDGTMPIGKPGFIFLLNLVYPDGGKEQLFSDESWQTAIAASWRPGGYKRWYLRSFQEIFDARLYPYGWYKGATLPANQTAPPTPYSHTPPAHPTWLPASLLDLPSSRPSLCSPHADYLFDTQGDPNTGEIRQRSIPLTREYPVPVSRLTESYWLKWKFSPDNFFDFNIPGACEKGGELSVKERNATWSFILPGSAPPMPASLPTLTIAPSPVNVDGREERSAVLTFVLSEQVVGFPFFTITAPEGTIVELLVHEAHETGAALLINTHFNSWSRFICREGINTFETFDFESVKYIQLHIRNAQSGIVLGNIGVRRRTYPWRHQPHPVVSDPIVSKVLEACLNTQYNSAIETCVDGMGRERQQYSGDGGQQLHAIQLVLGEPLLHARFCNTFSQGCTLDGYFMDSWPAYDRIARLFERQLDLSKWGPLLDHSIGFFFDCFYYYHYTGEVESIRETFPRLVKCLHYLLSLRREDGLLPVEDVGVHWVWMDTDSYPRQAYKKCAFNLYMIAMLRHAFAPLATAFGEKGLAAFAEKEAAALLTATKATFWHPSLQTFVDNPGEPEPHFNERALSLAILYDLCPDNNTAPSLQIMAELPKELGRSYPANANWNYWAYAKARRADLILKDIRERWNAMESVHQNNTTSESWKAKKDSGDQWSHCAVAPLFCLYMNIAGIQPVTAGWEDIEIAPQLFDLEEVSLVVPTPKGDLHFHAKGSTGSRTLSLELPDKTTCWLVLDEKETIDLPQSTSSTATTGAPGTKRYRLEGGQKISIPLKFS